MDGSRVQHQRRDRAKAPPTARQLASPGCPGATGKTAEAALVGLDIVFRRRMASLLSAGFEPTRQDWLEKAAHMGRRLELNSASGRIEGVMEGSLRMGR